MLLSKGFEVEVYTGTREGEIVGLSHRIVQDLRGFVREPDSRNVEYTTAPLCNYDKLLCALLRPRQQLRRYLETLGDYTIVPGSTLSLGDSSTFFRSDPQNPYHEYIEKTYHTNIVTASVHINIGISNTEKLIQAYRLIRCEAPLLLALSASSPFLDNRVTGYHSTRWHLFPHTPKHVPLFHNHSHFIQWMEKQLSCGTMQNVRHLWCSVRPNGDNRPYSLNRLELRICDLVLNPLHLLAITALLEARITQVLADDTLDPLKRSTISQGDLETELLKIIRHNEEAASRDSLEAKLYHWQDGREIIARHWLENLLAELYPLAKQLGFACFLSPVYNILRDGNQAQQWLRQYQQGMSIREIIQQAIDAVYQEEKELEDKLCQTIVTA
ncbi:MAG: glutamate--cysteine ligase [Geminocystis sp.]|nr:glutamate--cysteine ligase [Geminocystis sp.]MCS7148907.1 glutamate--cysteine ligase [Geminocystis sp.]MCX8077462.1 glutamate--cysteine ligase [Geminocystis sp.]MDW8116992.1 glutamate--cysteine ligase [Geminocystis sp.]MDW8463768.1 glutamate--cysteine ligase [Geminocystis sp.]